MSSIESIAAITAVTDLAQTSPAMVNPSMSFTEMLAHKIHNVEVKIDNANALVRDFSVDDTIPIHQVTIALEEARMAVELALQVRTRLIEGYREIMNMQL